MAMGNSNYLNAAAHSVENQIDKRFRHVWIEDCPVLAFIKMGKSNWNKGVEIRGNDVLVPLVLEDLTLPAAGVLDANELTGMAFNATNGHTQAKFIYAHYRAQYTIRESERVQQAGVRRGNLLESKVNQIIGSFKTQVSKDVASNTDGTRAKLPGVPYMIALANSVGGIDQNDADNAKWRAAAVNTTSAPLNLQMIDDDYDACNARNDGNSKPDLLLASYNTNVNVYGKIRTIIGSSERLVNVDGKANYGLTNFKLDNMWVVQDSRWGTVLSTTGGYAVMTTKHWFGGGGERPRSHGLHQIEGTDAYHNVYTHWCYLACDNIGANAKRTGLTG